MAEGKTTTEQLVEDLEKISQRNEQLAAQIEAKEVKIAGLEEELANAQAERRKLAGALREAQDAAEAARRDRNYEADRADAEAHKASQLAGQVQGLVVVMAKHKLVSKREAREMIALGRSMAFPKRAEA